MSSQIGDILTYTICVVCRQCIRLKSLKYYCTCGPKSKLSYYYQYPAWNDYGVVSMKINLLDFHIYEQKQFDDLMFIRICITLIISYLFKYKGHTFRVLIAYPISLIVIIIIFINDV